MAAASGATGTTIHCGAISSRFGMAGCVGWPSSAAHCSIVAPVVGSCLLPHRSRIPPFSCMRVIGAQCLPSACSRASLSNHISLFTSYVRVIPRALHGRRFATILDIVGLPPSSLPATAIDSVSQWSALSGGLRTGPRRTLLHHVTPDGRGKIRDGDWQLYTQNASQPGGFFSLCNPAVDGWSGTPTLTAPHGVTESPPDGPAACGDSPCLYNVSVGADAAERHNVASAHPEVVARLSAHLRAAACPTCDVDYVSATP